MQFITSSFFLVIAGVLTILIACVYFGIKKDSKGFKFFGEFLLILLVTASSFYLTAKVIKSPRADGLFYFSSVIIVSIWIYSSITSIIFLIYCYKKEITDRRKNEIKLSFFVGAIVGLIIGTIIGLLHDSISGVYIGLIFGLLTGLLKAFRWTEELKDKTLYSKEIDDETPAQPSTPSEKSEEQ